MPTPTRRPESQIVKVLSLDREAVQVLEQHAPTTKGYGRFISRLLYEYAARQEERSKIRQALAGTGVFNDEA
jgi:hypothetical protein